MAAQRGRASSSPPCSGAVVACTQKGSFARCGSWRARPGAGLSFRWHTNGVSDIAPPQGLAASLSPPTQGSAQGAQGPCTAGARRPRTPATGRAPGSPGTPAAPRDLRPSPLRTRPDEESVRCTCIPSSPAQFPANGQAVSKSAEVNTINRQAIPLHAALQTLQPQARGVKAQTRQIM